MNYDILYTMSGYFIFDCGKNATLAGILFIFGIGCGGSSELTTFTAYETISTNNDTSTNSTTYESSGETGNPTQGNGNSEGEAGSTSSSTATNTSDFDETNSSTTSGTNEPPDFDILPCNYNYDEIKLLVPKFNEYVAYNKVPLYWQAGANVATVHVYLSNNHSNSYSYHLGEVVSEGPGFQLWDWDSTVTKQLIEIAEGSVQPTGYRIALAAFDNQGELVGCDRSINSFEIRGWPENDFENVSDLDFYDVDLTKSITKQVDLNTIATVHHALNIENSKVDHLGGLAHFPLLQDLDVRYNKVFNIWEISWMTLLTKLDLSDNPLSSGSLRALGTLRNLQELDLINSELNNADLLHLPTLPNLQTLRLIGNPLQSLTNLAPYPLLQTLDLSNTQLESLEGLQPALSQLKVLSLSDNHLTNLVGLPGYPQLQFLEIYDNLNLQNLEGFPSNLSQLQGLYVRSCQLESLKGLPAYLPLQELLIDHNQLTDDSLKDLPDYPQLKKLWIHANLLTDVAKIANYTSLEELSLGNNTIKSGVKALANLKKLKWLDLFDNPDILCADIAFLENALPDTYIYTGPCK